MFNNFFALSIDRADRQLGKERNKSVCDLGNQTMACQRAVESIWKRRKFVLPDEPKTPKEFYRKLGYDRYLAIDVNEYNDAVAMDLNTVVKYTYSFDEQFDLVTNNGTGEHVFNQHAVFANCHNLCKKGGIMLHILPCYRWPDHGFYNFNPVLFASLAKQNKYDILFSGFATPSANERHDYKFSVHRNKKWPSELKFHEWKQDPTLYVAMRKKEDNTFSVPQQEMYSGDNITSKEITNKYAK
jgi:SAM-dependent methyltransferase